MIFAHFGLQQLGVLDSFFTHIIAENSNFIKNTFPTEIPLI